MWATSGSPGAQNLEIREAGASFIGKFLMALFPHVRKISIIAVLAALVGAAQGQGNYAPEGGEFNISGQLLGEQVYPTVSISPSGGYLVWQDNITDGDSAGISALKLDGSLAGTLSTFRVNEIATGLQERPVVSVLKNGGAAFVWVGGSLGFQHVYGRFISPAGWVTGDVLINTATNQYQSEAALATLTNGNVVVTWSSSGQVSPTSMRDVYFQILTPMGQKFGGESPVNQTTAYNQRTAAVSALSDGRFVVVWVSEQQRFENSVDLYGRIFSSTGQAASSEFLINTSTNVCANPSIAAAPDGGFVVAWMERDLENNVNGWQVYTRPVSAGAQLGTARLVNAWQTGDQLAPKIAAINGDYLVSWTSMAQDGSRDGAYGRFLSADGSLHGDEFRINTTTVGNQMHPTVASDGAARFLAVWTSFVGGGASYDLFAQRYVNLSQPLAAPSAPFVTVLSSSSLSVSWPVVSGLPVANYEVYADGSTTASATVTDTYWNATGLAASSTHSYKVAYVLSDGRRSPLSASNSGTTYSSGSYFGIPFEWMVQYNWGQSWPTVSFDSDGDGMSNYKEFLAGTDPTDGNSVLKVRLQATPQGLFLNWNSHPGLMYQVWSSSSAAGPWIKVGAPRFAAGTVDSMYVGGNGAGFYQIERLR